MGKMPDANAHLADTGFSAERPAICPAERAGPRFPATDAGGADPAAVRPWSERVPG